MYSKKMENKFKNLYFLAYLITISNIKENIPKNDILDMIKKKEKNLFGVIIATELHISGMYHYHLLIVYNKRRKIINPNIYNYILNKKVNIQGVNSLLHAIDYVEKCGDFVSYNLDKSVVGDKGKRKTAVLVMDNKISDKDIYNHIINTIIQFQFSLEQIIDFCKEKDYKYHNILHKNIKQIKNIIAFNKEFNTVDHNTIIDFLNVTKHFEYFCTQLYGSLSQIENKHQNTNKRHHKETDILYKSSNQKYEQYTFDKVEYTILGFILKSLEHKYNRPHKSLNLHLFSERASYGKTTFLTQLSKLMKIYYYPPIQWFMEYSNKTYNAIIWDEFKLPINTNHFNLFFEGVPVDLPIKYSNNITKIDNPLIICCSNQSIRGQLEYRYKTHCIGCYRKPLQYEHESLDCSYKPEVKTIISTINARLYEIKLQRPLFTLINCLAFIKQQIEDEMKKT